MPSLLNDRTARVTPRDPWAKGSCDRPGARGGGEPKGNCVLGDGHRQRPSSTKSNPPCRELGRKMAGGTCPAGDPRGSQLLDGPLVVPSKRVPLGRL